VIKLKRRAINEDLWWRPWRRGWTGRLCGASSWQCGL